ncbi:hypothetical protein ACLMJK_002794 [Lecanora helva]
MRQQINTHMQNSQADIVTNGPYTIINCGRKNASTVADALVDLGAYLQIAIADVKQSSKTPSAAYTTFFKDESIATDVATLLTNVTTGDPIYPANSFSNGSAIFVCLSEPGQMHYVNATNDKIDAYSVCQNTEQASFTITNSVYTVLCPTFFAPPPGLPAGYPNSVPKPSPGKTTSDCLAVDAKTGQFIGDGNSLTAFAPWFLLEGLVHYYLATAATLAPNYYDPNECAGLNAPQAATNAHNYVYYAASEWSLH